MVTPAWTLIIPGCETSSGANLINSRRGRNTYHGWWRCITPLDQFILFFPHPLYASSVGKLPCTSALIRKVKNLPNSRLVRASFKLVAAVLKKKFPAVIVGFHEVTIRLHMMVFWCRTWSMYCKERSSTRTIKRMLQKNKKNKETKILLIDQNKKNPRPST